ncbi:MAG: CPBP family intramembrane metalloprotease [Flavobacterium sp.]|nr:MAG: CPBP family intramembrane metalloprotease [Flavobacterium sp.]
MDTNTLLKQKLLSLLLLAGVFAFIYNPWTKFPYTFACITAMVLLFTWLQEKSLGGLNFKSLRLNDVAIILGLFISIEAVADFIVQPAANSFFNEPADYSAFRSIQGNAPKYFKYLLYMWISAAVGEEVFFRAFAFLQLRKIVGNHFVLTVLLSAVLFALPHLYQGAAGLVVTFFFGLVFGAIYLKFKNIWINIIVHGLIDTFFITMAYYGELDYFG